MERRAIHRLLSAAAAAAITTSVLADGTLVPLDVHECALHTLNRLAFGPRPGEVDRVVTGREVDVPETVEDKSADGAARTSHPEGKAISPVDVGAAKTTNFDQGSARVARC